MEVSGGFFLVQDEIDEKNGTDGYGTVGDVKGGPVMRPDMKVEKVDDFTETNPVDEISDGTTHYKGKGNDQKEFFILDFL